MVDKQNMDAQQLVEDIKRNARKLDVYKRGKLVGHIVKRLDDDGYQLAYDFTYLKSATPADAVSLIMPVRDEPWVYKGMLHPVFQQNLPEGMQLSLLLQRFGKLVMDEDMVLLGMTGSQAIGNLQVVPHGYAPDWAHAPRVDVGDLPDNGSSRQFVLGLLDEFAHTQGVSGQMPKALVDDIPEALANAKIALRTEQYILKTETSQFEGAILSEVLCQQAALNAGLNVASGMLSPDGTMLASQRFDTDGFEDMCSVMGMPAHRKMRGSLEKAAELIRAFSADAETDLRTLIKWHIFNTAAGNSEGHMKNLGFTINGDQVRLAPLYDILCTRAFDHLRDDMPAMMVGVEREWVLSRAFERTALRFGISGAELIEMKTQVAEALNQMLEVDLPACIETYPHFAKVGNNMLEIVREGVQRLVGEVLTSKDTSAENNLPQG